MHSNFSRIGSQNRRISEKDDFKRKCLVYLKCVTLSCPCIVYEMHMPHVDISTWNVFLWSIPHWTNTSSILHKINTYSVHRWAYIRNKNHNMNQIALAAATAAMAASNLCCICKMKWDSWAHSTAQIDSKKNPSFRIFRNE